MGINVSVVLFTLNWVDTGRQLEKNTQSLSVSSGSSVSPRQLDLSTQGIFPPVFEEEQRRGEKVQKQFRPREREREKGVGTREQQKKVSFFQPDTVM